LGHLVFGVMNTNKWSIRLGVGRGADSFSPYNTTCHENRREGDQGPELSCSGVEQEDVLVTGNVLINITVFVCIFIAFCDINAILHGSNTTHE